MRRKESALASPKQFAAEGASVIVNYASSKSDADKVVDEITKRGGKAVAVQGNVAKKVEVERLFSTAEKAFGQIDILVNNAGVYEFGPLEEVTEKQFHWHFDTNVLGMLLATQEALKHFNSAGGSIVNVSSLASSLTPPTAVVYNATKGAVDAITRTLAKELGPRKIRVNSVNPGMVITDGVVARDSIKAISGKLWNRRRRWVESVRPTTSHRPQFFSRQTIRNGSREKRCSSREAFVSSLANQRKDHSHVNSKSRSTVERKFG